MQDRRTMQISNYHAWGCPVLALESKIQTDPKCLPKWNPRDRLGTCLGNSPVHAGNAALVFNASTDHASPKCHLVFEDDFITMESMKSGNVPQIWQDLVSQSPESVTVEDCNLSQTWFR